MANKPLGFRVVPHTIRTPTIELNFCCSCGYLVKDNRGCPQVHTGCQIDEPLAYLEKVHGHRWLSNLDRPGPWVTFFENKKTSPTSLWFRAGPTHYENTQFLSGFFRLHTFVQAVELKTTRVPDWLLRDGVAHTLWEHPINISFWRMTGGLWKPKRHLRMEANFMGIVMLVVRQNVWTGLKTHLRAPYYANCTVSECYCF